MCKLLLPDVLMLMGCYQISNCFALLQGRVLKRRFLRVVQILCTNFRSRRLLRLLCTLKLFSILPRSMTRALMLRATAMIASFVDLRQKQTVLITTIQIDYHIRYAQFINNCIFHVFYVIRSYVFSQIHITTYHISSNCYSLNIQYRKNKFQAFLHIDEHFGICIM